MTQHVSSLGITTSTAGATGMRVTYTDPNGVERPIDEMPTDASPEIAIRVVVPTIEAECMKLIRNIRGALGALSEFVQLANPALGARENFHRQTSTDIADNVVRVLRAEAVLAYQVCMGVKDSDPLRLQARKMLGEYAKAMRRVDETKDAGPGIRLGRVWMFACYQLLHVNSAPWQRAEAMRTWNEESRKALAKV